MFQAKVVLPTLLFIQQSQQIQKANFPLKSLLHANPNLSHRIRMINVNVPLNIKIETITSKQSIIPCILDG